MARRRLIDPQQLRRLRILAGFDQPELARRAGLSKVHIWNIEAGRRDGSPETLHKIANAIASVYPCTVEDLMADTEKASS